MFGRQAIVDRDDQALCGLRQMAASGIRLGDAPHGPAAAVHEIDDRDRLAFRDIEPQRNRAIGNIDFKIRDTRHLRPRRPRARCDQFA